MKRVPRVERHLIGRELTPHVWGPRFNLKQKKKIQKEKSSSNLNIPGTWLHTICVISPVTITSCQSIHEHSAKNLEHNTHRCQQILHFHMCTIQKKKTLQTDSRATFILKIKHELLRDRHTLPIKEAVFTAYPPGSEHVFWKCSASSQILSSCFFTLGPRSKQQNHKDDWLTNSLIADLNSKCQIHRHNGVRKHRIGKRNNKPISRWPMHSNSKATNLCGFILFVCSVTGSIAQP